MTFVDALAALLKAVDEATKAIPDTREHVPDEVREAVAEFCRDVTMARRALKETLMRYGIVVSILVAVLLPGCASLPGGQSELDQTLAQVSAFAEADLQAALAMAERNGDTIAAQCWSGILEAKRAAAARPDVEVKGVASAFQFARSVRRSLDGNLPLKDQLNLACAPLVLDSAQAIAGIAGRVGLKIGTSGLLPF